MTYRGFTALSGTPKYSICLDKRHCRTLEFQVEQLLVIHVQVFRVSSFCEMRVPLTVKHLVLCVIQKALAFLFIMNKMDFLVME
jgi:hypothetical protein